MIKEIRTLNKAWWICCDNFTKQSKNKLKILILGTLWKKIHSAHSENTLIYKYDMKHCSSNLGPKSKFSKSLYFILDRLEKNSFHATGPLKQNSYFFKDILQADLAKAAGSEWEQPPSNGRRGLQRHQVSRIQKNHVCYLTFPVHAIETRSWIHDRTISLRFLGKILGVPRLEVSVWIS